MTLLDQKYIDLYDQYTHSDMPRRDFLDRLARLCGGTALAGSILPLLEVNYAQAAVISDDDKRLESKMVSFDKKSKAYLTHLKGKDPKSMPAVIVIHENKGLQPHIKDVARRAALLGYVAVAPDGLSLAGGSPEDPEKAKALIQKQDAKEALDIFTSAVTYADGVGNGKVGCVGFCWGGAMANKLSLVDKLDAAVVFYGRQLSKEDAANIKAPLQLHYAGLDERINAGIKDYEEALKSGKKSYELFVYEKVQHAFHNDTAGERYNKAAADLAWSRTTAFFQKHLGPVS